MTNVLEVLGWTQIDDQTSPCQSTVKSVTIDKTYLKLLMAAVINRNYYLWSYYCSYCF